MEDLISNITGKKSGSDPVKTSAKKPASPGEKYFAAAQDYYRQGKYREAVAMGELSLELMDRKKTPVKKILTVHEFLASAYGKSGDYSSAIREYTILSKMAPGNKSYRMKAKAARRDLYVSQLKTALMYMQSAGKYYNSGRFTDAATHADRALTLLKASGASQKEIAKALALQGKCYLKLKDYGRAQFYFSEALRADPSQKECSRLLAEAERLSQAAKETAAGTETTGTETTDTGGIYYSSGTYKNNPPPLNTSPGASYKSGTGRTSSYPTYNRATHYRTSSSHSSNPTIYINTYSNAGNSGSQSHIQAQNDRLMREQEAQRQQIQARNQELINSHTNQRSYQPRNSNPSYSNPSYSNPSYRNPSSGNPHSR
jgi:tetratricopeptide (TPR) repeat protein